MASYSSRPLRAILLRECQLAIQSPWVLIQPILFSLMIISLFPLAVANQLEDWNSIAPAILWMVLLITCLKSTDGLYREDFEDGSLTLIFLSVNNHYFVQLLRVAIYWLMSGLLLALFSPLMLLMLNLPTRSCLEIAISFMLGSLSLIYLGAIGSALTLAIKQAGLLLMLIILPLYVPILILGTATVQQAVIEGERIWNYLSLMAAVSCLIVALAPLAINSALKINIEAQ